MVIENTDRRHVNHCSDNVRETLRYQLPTHRNAGNYCSVNKHFKNIPHPPSLLHKSNASRHKREGIVPAHV